MLKGVFDLYLGQLARPVKPLEQGIKQKNETYTHN